MTLGFYIKKIRKKYGLSSTKLGKLLGVNRTYQFRVESDKDIPMKYIFLAFDLLDEKDKIDFCLDVFTQMVEQYEGKNKAKINSVKKVARSIKRKFQRAT